MTVGPIVKYRHFWVYKSAINGRFVSKAFAEKYPENTFKQAVKARIPVK